MKEDFLNTRGSCPSLPAPGSPKVLSAWNRSYQVNAIELETDRLLLRMWREDDFQTYEKMCADPEVMRFLGGRTFDTLEAWRHMAFHIGHWQLRGYGHWAVEEKSSGEFIGRLGFLNPAGWPTNGVTDEEYARAKSLGKRLRHRGRATSAGLRIQRSR